MIRPIFVFLILAASASAASLKWARRATQAVACAAGALDVISSAQGNRPGYYESTGIFRRQDGHASILKLSVWHAGICGAQWAIGEIRPSAHKDAALFVAGAGWTAATVSNPIHNWTLQARKEAQ